MKHALSLFNITEVAVILEGFPRNLRSSVWNKNFSRDFYMDRYITYF
jgi:hypothetical protein